jgi:hypothetical protein
LLLLKVLRLILIHKLSLPLSIHLAIVEHLKSLSSP